MPGRTDFRFRVLPVVLMLCLLPLAAGAADVSGTMEVNKKKVRLSYGYVDMMKPAEPLIVLSDKPLPDGEVPFLSADYAEKNKVHAIIFAIIASEKKLSDEIKLLYTGGDHSSPTVGYPADIVSLTVRQADGAMVEGTIKTTKPGKLSDLTYSFSASFKLSTRAALGKANTPKKASFKGDDSAPVKAYKDYYRAVMAGDAEAMKKNLCARSLKEFEEMADPKDQAMVMGLMQMRPEAINIEKPAITGDEAAFTARGKEGKSEATGTIRMKMEDGSWKVLQDKWSMEYK